MVAFLAGRGGRQWAQETSASERADAEVYTLKI